MPLQATSGAASYDAFGGGVAAVPNYIEDVFSTYLYTGNGSTQTITNGIDLAGEGGLTWLKARDTTTFNSLFDTNRGGDNRLVSSITNAQSTYSGNVTSFNSDGFSIGDNSQTNQSGFNYASWTFRKQPKFFDIVTYTGNGTSQAIAHNLGSVPACIIVKRIDSISNWTVYHTATGTYRLRLNTTEAKDEYGFWSTAPTSTHFTVSNSDINNDVGTYVAYLFAHDAGGFGLTGTDNVISCGSFENGTFGGTATLPFPECQWALVKCATGAGPWFIVDNMRGLYYNGTDAAGLLANSSDAEQTRNIDMGTVSTSNGQLRIFGGDDSPGNTYIYIAIRRGPMKVPTSGTSVFSPVTRTGTGSATTQTAGFPVDLFIPKTRNGGTAFTWSDRLRGDVFVQSANANAENYPAYTTFDNQTGVNLTSYFYPNNAASEPYVNYNFRRAPSFFDEVCYTGNGTSGATQAHNLTVTPELMIIKSRSNAENWGVWCSYTPTKEIYLNLAGSYGSGNDATASATTITLQGMGGTSAINASGQTYVAYLFATCAGVSKVGSYTGTATTKQIDCGFTAGARFVLIKRTDSTGDWYVWDTARGIVSGNDPYLLLNSTAAEVTSTDYIDTYSAGFEISSTAPAAINASGGTFIFLAIA